MITVLPNWHPALVHFTIALFTTSVVFFVLARFLSDHKMNNEFLNVAHWTLWSSALCTVATIALGFYAFYTVAHDMPSHMAMIRHRNWGIPTATIIFLLAFWSWLQYRAKKQPSNALITVLLVGLILLGATAWHGGELVYRYGLGVQSLPQVEGAGHDH